MPNPSLEELKSLFESYGVRNHSYLEFSYDRYVSTKSLALKKTQGKLTVLDIGAHYLFNAIFYASEGHKVIGADLFEDQGEFDTLVKIAGHYDIDLLRYKNLYDPDELQAIPESTVDLVLFTEILEHITFNPVRFWESIYRILKPGGRIVVTTPNYKYPPFFLRDILNILRGNGSGIMVRDILEINTYGHHWKLFTGKEAQEYARLLSPDFRTARLDYFTSHFPANKAKSLILKGFSAVPWLRENLYCEWLLEHKRSGITVKPHW